MKKMLWEELTILFVMGASIEDATAVIRRQANTGAGGKRIFDAEGGVLVHVRNTDSDAGEIRGCLISKFGEDRVVDASQVKPSELARQKLLARMG